MRPVEYMYTSSRVCHSQSYFGFNFYRSQVSDNWRLIDQAIDLMSFFSLSSWLEKVLIWLKLVTGCMWHHL